MTNNLYLQNGLRFLLLVLAQVLIFNRLNFLGFINPMVYILFLYWYPIKQRRSVFIIICFILGLAIDVFSDTLAFHAVACATMAFFRPTIMRFVFGVNYEFQSFKLSNTTRAQQIAFLTFLILGHHTIFFLLEIFSLSHLLLLLKKIVFTGLGTLVLGILMITLFSAEKE
ncbi:rod shape-determining protein MreD [Muriicola jejuensis]|uniref:Rod shape-determining protein MreD n=1 Tax=Muriicola jejuensis TaxID=504488 RepID=A0A6P0UF66_9FLAO|nr:rod shape-determining protein MreD [Muriicola jejuensis]NER11657.1 rod shape-determining protein MreD [Muriicola jejuensis]SMP25591.1 rod shape-determining protein MreD [Muriicola jejuensis]